MAGKVSSARRGVTIVHGGKPRPMSSAQLRFLRGRVMRYACADVLLERLEREGLISDDERKQLAKTWLPLAGWLRAVSSGVWTINERNAETT